MASIFEELASFDRPVVDVKIQVGKKVLDLQAQRPNALETDAIEAYYGDEYARIILEKTEPREDGRPCELEQMRGLYAARTREELTTQLLGTRTVDIERLTFEKLDFNITQTIQDLLELSEEDRKTAIAERQEQMKVARAAASAEIKTEYDQREFEELVELISQVNVNVKAIAEAQKSKDAMYLYFCLSKDGERICPSAEEIRARFQADTITAMVRQVNAAFAAESAPDLPFELPGESAPDGQPSSQSTSEADTKIGGKRTRTTRGNSKQSSTPAASNRSKNP